MKRSPIRQRARTKHQVANVEHREYVAWIHTQPCAWCGYSGEHVQAVHVGRGGVGKEHGTDAETIPLCGPRWVAWQVGGAAFQGCHALHDQFRGSFQEMTSIQRRAWDAHQVAVHRGRFEARNVGMQVVPF